MNTEDFTFDLPEALIALRPAEPKDSARLLVVHGDGRLQDCVVTDLPGLLSPGDRLVFNDTRVLPAALRAVRPARDAAGRDVDVDLNLMEPAGSDEWTVLARPGRRLEVGDKLLIADGFSATIQARDADGAFRLSFHVPGGMALEDALEQAGNMPLPPYIARRRAADQADKTAYQTLYAGDDAKSVAAPTAGLHFTEALLNRIDTSGLHRETVRLHVGRGTFSPLSQDAVKTNRLHKEWCQLDAETASRLNRTREMGHRVIPIGTTSLRTLETAYRAAGRFQAFEGETDIFLKPGDEFHATDVLMTNFHLPGSSLFMLVCGLMGTEIMQSAYAHAIAQSYRFYSYGDACLLLPGGHER